MDADDDTAGWYRRLSGHSGHHLHLRGAVVECSCGKALGDAGGVTMASGDVACDACGAAGVARIRNAEPGSSAITLQWAE